MKYQPRSRLPIERLDKEDPRGSGGSMASPVRLAVRRYLMTMLVLDRLIAAHFLGGRLDDMGRLQCLVRTLYQSPLIKSLPSWEEEHGLHHVGICPQPSTTCRCTVSRSSSEMTISRRRVDFVLDFVP